MFGGRPLSMGRIITNAVCILTPPLQSGLGCGDAWAEGETQTKKKQANSFFLETAFEGPPCVSTASSLSSDNNMPPIGHWIPHRPEAYDATGSSGFLRLDA
jgi:hypothetical protein